jgi:glycogen debranching enzyme
MLTILDGNRFLVCDDLGNVGSGVEGLYCDDTRHLSRWSLTIDGVVPRLLSSGLHDYATAAVYARHDAGSASHPSPVAAVRELFVSASSFQERLLIENHSPAAVEFVVRYEFDTDFLDLFEVKAHAFGERDLTFVRSTTPLRTSRGYDAPARTFMFETEGLGFAAHLAVAFSQAGIADDRACVWEVELPPRAGWQLEAGVRFGDGLVADSAAGDLPRDRRRVRDSQRSWAAEMPTLETSFSRLPHTYRRSLADLGALRMRGAGEGAALPAAGLPWFMCPFGRDSIITSLQTLPLGDGLARTALRSLGALQAVDDDPKRDSEPGKILHEMRSGKVARLGGQFPYYGSVDSTPLYLILLHETWRWSGDDDLVRDLEPIARAALDWLDTYADPDGDGFVEWRMRAPRGLEVQCWKDSWDSMRHADGRMAEGPFAVSEVQGYVYAARVRCAELARVVWRDDALASRLELEAAALRERFDRAFWIERDGQGYYALALDGAKQPVDALTSNAGHLLFTGIAFPWRVASVASAMLSDRMFTGYGVRTMALGSGGYNPIGYHVGTVWPHDTSIIAYGLGLLGHRSESAQLASALDATAEHFGWRLPEVVAGYDRERTGFPVEYPTACSPQAWAAGAPLLCLRSLLGLEPDPATRTLRVDPSLTADEWPAAITWRGVRAFGRRFDVITDQDGGRVVET